MNNNMIVGNFSSDCFERIPSKRQPMFPKIGSPRSGVPDQDVLDRQAKSQKVEEKPKQEMSILKIGDELEWLGRDGGLWLKNHKYKILGFSNLDPIIATENGNYDSGVHNPIYYPQVVPIKVGDELEWLGHTGNLWCKGCKYKIIGVMSDRNGRFLINSVNEKGEMKKGKEVWINFTSNWKHHPGFYNAENWRHHPQVVPI